MESFTYHTPNIEDAMIANGQDDSVEATVHAWYQGVMAAKPSDAMLQLSDDFRFSRLGKTPLSGIFVGAEAKARAVLDLCRDELGLDGRIAEYRVAIVDGLTVVCLASSLKVGDSDADYNQRWLHIFHVRDGKIAEIAEYLDTVELEKAVFNNELVSPRNRVGNQFTIHSEADPERTASREECHGIIFAMQDALTSGNFTKYISLHSDDYIINFIGNTPLSGHFQGAEEHFDIEMGSVIARLNPEFMSFKKSRVIAVGNSCACVVLRGGGPTLSGDFYDQQYVQLLRFGQGKVMEVHQFFDTVEVERALFGNPLSRKSGYPTARPFVVDEILTSAA